jgi:hypothetical protein
MPAEKKHDPKYSAPYGLVGGFTRLPRDLRRSLAYVCLPPTAQLVLIDIIDTWDQSTHYKPLHATLGHYISYPHSETAVGCSRQQFAAALKQLERCGWIIRPDSPAAAKPKSNGHEPTSAADVADTIIRSSLTAIASPNPDPSQRTQLRPQMNWVNH